MREKAIICDIDGCLLDTNPIHREIEEKQLTGAEKWLYFETYANDIEKVVFNQNLGSIIEALADKGYKVIISTARSERIKKATIRKLKFNLNCDFKIFMRPQDDISPACEIKRKHLKEIKEKYDVYLAIDDEDANLKMFSNNGLFVMKAM